MQYLLFSLLRLVRLLSALFRSLPKPQSLTLHLLLVLVAIHLTLFPSKTDKKNKRKRKKDKAQGTKRNVEALVLQTYGFKEIPFTTLTTLRLSLSFLLPDFSQATMEKLSSLLQLLT